MPDELIITPTEVNKCGVSPRNMDILNNGRDYFARR